MTDQYLTPGEDGDYSTEDLDRILSAATHDQTVAGFFEDCLISLWDEGEGFSGKRPKGNSGWQYQIVHDLAVAGLIPSKEETWGLEIPREAETEAFRAIRQALFYMARKSRLGRAEGPS